MVQKLSGTADGNSRKSGGKSQGWVNTRRGNQGQNNFNQNQGRPNLLENEKSGFPNNDKNFKKTSRKHVLDADKKGIELNNVGTVFIAGVPNT